jgi:hypothetical protein
MNRRRKRKAGKEPGGFRSRLPEGAHDVQLPYDEKKREKTDAGVSVHDDI